MPMPMSMMPPSKPPMAPPPADNESAPEDMAQDAAEGMELAIDAASLQKAGGQDVGAYQPGDSFNVSAKATVVTANGGQLEVRLGGLKISGGGAPEEEYAAGWKGQP